MEEYIKILEEIVETYRSCSVNEEGFDMKVDIGFTKKECEALESLLTKYKEYDNLLGEIDSKEASDALYMLWHCALINKEFETQKQQFQIVNAYIKQLEEENKNCKKEYHSLINKIENKIDKFDYEFEKAKRKNDKDRADYYWDLIGNFTKLLREE